MRRLALPGFLLRLSPVATPGSPACEEQRQQAAFIMDARLGGERREALAADLAEWVNIHGGVHTSAVAFVR